MNSLRRSAAAANDLKLPEGFDLFRTDAFEGACDGIEILLPIALCCRLVEERRALTTSRGEERRLSLERYRNDREALRTAVTPSARTLGDAVAQRDFIRRFERGVMRRDRTSRHAVLHAQEVIRVLARMATGRNKEDYKRELEVMDKVMALGALRLVANPARHAERWAQAVASLRASHPQFRAVTDFVAEHVTLSTRSKKPLTVPALHIWGPPGIGKSHYANDLAIALEAPLRRHSMENAQTTALLLGTERHWSTAMPGIVFDQIVLGRYANPVFLIDELDKAPQSGGYDPLRPLHSLLEPFTAATVRDAALDITFDASLAIYIAASNDPRRIPESLRSRFSEFEISQPRGEHAIQIAQIVANRTVEELSVPDFRPPEPRLVNRIAHLTPRAIRKAVQLAAARAIANGRLYLKASDLPVDELGNEAPEGVLH